MTTPPTNLQTALRRAGAKTSRDGNHYWHCNRPMDTTQRRHRCSTCGITIENLSAQHPGIVQDDDNLWTIYQHSLADSALNADPGYARRDG